MQKGFTVLELLVVIAIIGILSSIILVSYNGYTNKARLAKTLQWAGSINHSLGDRAVGAWTFDNISGPTVYDDSGLGNNGTIYNGALVVDGVIGKALSFDGNNDHIGVSSKPELKYTGKDMTISVWVNPSNLETTGGYIISKPWNGGGQYNYMLVYTSVNKIQMCVSGSTGSCTFSLSADEVFSISKWYHLTIVLEGSANSVKIYINGSLAKQGVHSITNWAPTLGDANTALSIATLYPYGTGWAGNNGYSFNGLIDDVRIFSAALTQAQIQQHYADGLKSHPNFLVEK